MDYKCMGCGEFAVDKISKCFCPTRSLYNPNDKKDVINKIETCINHSNRPKRENLDGDDLCLECCIQ